jgi:hypothetical protein
VNKQIIIVMDAPNPSSLSWLERNAGVVMTFVIAAIGFIAWLIRLEFRVNELVKAQAKSDECVDEHLANTQIHIDPVRDERRWAEQRVDMREMQAKLDRVLEVLGRYQ